MPDVIGESVVGDIGEIDGAGEGRGHGGGLITQPCGIAGVGRLNQVLCRCQIEVGADEPRRCLTPR